MPLNPFLNQDHGLKVIQSKKHPESVPVFVPYVVTPARKESSAGLSGTNGCEGCLQQGHLGNHHTAGTSCFVLDSLWRKDFMSAQTLAHISVILQAVPCALDLRQFCYHSVSGGWAEVSTYHPEGFIYDLFL